ncbi:MAG: ATP-grasp fold amidoligase family protein, partial [Oscillospiraceae bacterium]|nr:ATP-grasp fold amidoligase family protein [Oscillospiraceae bacterium]
IYCFNGKPELVLVCFERDIDVQFEWYDLQWNVLEIGAKKNLGKAKCPSSLDQMIEYAENLCIPFPYVRVDFYERNRQPVLGELTFTPYYGMADYYSKEGCEWLGQKLQLPEKYPKHFK